MESVLTPAWWTLGWVKLLSPLGLCGWAQAGAGGHDPSDHAQGHLGWLELKVRQITVGVFGISCS